MSSGGTYISRKALDVDLQTLAFHFFLNSLIWLCMTYCWCDVTLLKLILLKWLRQFNYYNSHSV